jgi:hypothetical protein
LHRFLKARRLHMHWFPRRATLDVLLAVRFPDPIRCNATSFMDNETRQPVIRRGIRCLGVHGDRKIRKDSSYFSIISLLRRTCSSSHKSYPHPIPATILLMGNAVGVVAKLDNFVKLCGRSVYVNQHDDLRFGSCFCAAIILF